ncbi:MAG: hypothetical protein P4K86_13365 [Terracidiphilus sp.]|nr:hypothetical protein [Terracidiphilus sp.]MDR3777199.1 hypothetical protein [Terracidiphilus sp.]
MSQTFWESDTEDMAQSELEMQQEPESQEPEMQEPESEQPELHEPESQVHESQAPESQAPSAEAGSLALSVDDFSALEDRILRAVNLVKRERQARAAAEERAAQAESMLSEQAPLVERLQKDLNVLRSERDMVRQRVEKLLAQLDALEL